MKPTILILLTAATALAQGPLTPPGAPAPTMKTLDQIEARTPISTLPYTISTPGSYYLTSNLQFTATSGDAITITTDNVTLDLNGFTLSSVAAVTGHAIRVSNNLNNITIKNGSISGNTTVTISGSPPSQTWNTSPSGFDYAIYAYSTISRNLSVDHLQTSGCRISGILADYSSVTNSTANSNGTYGIIASYGSVTNSMTNLNGLTGIYAYHGSVGFSTARSNGGHGMQTESGSVTNSTARANAAIGIAANDGSVTSSTANNNSNYGIEADNGNVTNSMATSNALHGILVDSGSVTSCVAKSNNTTSTLGAVDLYAPNAVIAFTKYGSGTTTGSTLTGNQTP